MARAAPSGANVKGTLTLPGGRRRGSLSAALERFDDRGLRCPRPNRPHSDPLGPGPRNSETLTPMADEK